ncbi:MAG TPA: DNA/RNA nuclease SfsA [bacterium]|nr:DNA/RNA nuclease SfsA [bacterium]
MKWPDAPLVLGVFLERLHRFGARVKVRGRVEYCHVTNSGRLRELLRPGATVALVDHRSKGKALGTGPPRKTRYSIRLARYRGKWVCIEANVAPKLVREAWEKGKLAGLGAYGRLRSEVPLDRHTRFDLQARDPRTGRVLWVEVKCVTLVDQEGRGFFPDAPSERASKHLRELMALRRKPRTGSLVFFVLQNPLGLSVSPKEDTDPVFAHTLRKTKRAGVEIRVLRTRIGLKGAEVTGPGELRLGRKGL